MIGARANFTKLINNLRSKLNQLRIIDLSSIGTLIANLEENLRVAAQDPDATEIAGLVSPSKVEVLLPASGSYPRIDEFHLTLLSVGVLKYFFLAVPALIVQMLVDFGFTLAVIYAAWSMVPRQRLSRLEEDAGGRQGNGNQCD